MTRRKQGQRVLWEGMIDEDVRALWEPWMVQADRLLEDDELIDRVYEAQGERHEHSATKGRSQTPAEMVLRLLLLKHVRNWSFDTLEREVKLNLAYRDFTRIGMGKVPDAKTLARIAQALGGEVIAELHRRLVEMAQEEGVIQGRKLRVDTTVVETNIHYPTDSSLLGDGARVLTRTMKKIETQAGKLKRKVRDRRRSISKRVIAIATASRHRGPEGEAKRKKQYGELLRYTRQILNDAKRVMAEVQGLPAKKKRELRGLCEYLSEMAGRVRRVVKQAKARVLDGITDLPGKIVSLFEPHTEIIRKGKASKPTEFGKLVKIQEAENQIVTHYEVFEERPADSDLLVDAVAKHQELLGRTPEVVAADAGFYSQANEKALEERGIPHVSIPNKNTKSEARRKHQKQRWFKNGQRWRTGCEGRISVLKRRHGLDRCLYPGLNGMKRWVGMGVIADNLINIGLQLAV